MGSVTIGDKTYAIEPTIGLLRRIKARHKVDFLGHGVPGITDMFSDLDKQISVIMEFLNVPADQQEAMLETFTGGVLAQIIAEITDALTSFFRSEQQPYQVAAIEKQLDSVIAARDALAVKINQSTISEDIRKEIESMELDPLMPGSSSGKPQADLASIPILSRGAS